MKRALLILALCAGMLAPGLAGGQRKTPLEVCLDGGRDGAARADACRTAAEQGHADAQYILGVMYHEGRGGATGLRRGHALVPPGSRAGRHAFAQYILGVMYHEGEGVPQDYAEAMRWFRRAAEQGDPAAQSELGVMYHKGQGVLQDYAEAMRWFRRAAEQEDPFAQYNLGVMYYARARGCHRTTPRPCAGTAGQPSRETPTRSTIWAVMYNKGQGVPQDYAEAVRWYRRAAEQGTMPAAQFNLGVMYARNGQGVPLRTDAEAVRWYPPGSRAGKRPPAQFNLGVMYYKGLGVPQDDAEAMRWFRRAAEQGHADAQYFLGVMYYLGQGVPQDYAEAVRWFRRAAEQGHAAAQYNLGNMYNIGQGVPQDYAEAMRWFRRAAEQGDAEAQSNLGATCTTKARGCQRTDAEAVRWPSRRCREG